MANDLDIIIRFFVVGHTSYMVRAWLAHYSRFVRKSAKFLFIFLVLFRLGGDGLVLAACVGRCVTFVRFVVEYFS